MDPEKLWRKGFVKQVSFRLEWKVEGVTDGESEDGIVMKWCVQKEVNQEESEQDEVDG